MKKLDTTLRIKFKMPSLYREDLEEIESAITAIPNQSEFKIRTGNFEYDNVAEIAAGNRSVNEMTISSRKPYIRLSLYKSSAEIYGSGEEEALVTGIVNVIARIVKKRERRLRWINGHLNTLYFSVLTIIFINLFGPIRTKWIDQFTQTQLNAVLALTLLLIIISFRDSFFVYSSVNFESRSKKMNWLTRNKDQLIVGLINTIVSGAVGYFLGKAR